MARSTERTPRLKEGEESENDGASRSQARQPAASPDTGETPLEKFWQPLFDRGNPTMRLSQFLRGLALHLINDCEPKGNLVVTPAKMSQFVNETRREQEHYPWDIIFGGELTTVSISLMFQKLRCEHHLVQDQYDRVPTVPGLTPLGFASFMTYLIQAHPDTEYKRLGNAVMKMPISNADNKSERFPKELSKPQILRPLIDSTLNSSTACPLFRMHIISTRWLLRLSTTRLVIFSGRLSPISLSYASRKVLCRYKGGPIAGDLLAKSRSS